jgi:hypothetical protein
MHYEPFYERKFNSLEETEQMYNLLKFIQEETDGFLISHIIKGIWNNNFKSLKRETPDIDGFTGKFYLRL